MEGTSMDPSVKPLAVLLILMLLPLAISPRTVWRVLQSWKYKNPEQNEPSDDLYMLERVSSIGVIVILVGIILFM
jgi:hypothetical protein